MEAIEYIEAKSILSSLRQKDDWFGISYNMNLYRGCQHGCIYCDTRSECYGIGDISRIVVKKNAPELLRRELCRKRSKKGTIGTGSMNDPYMPIEAKLHHTRQALEIIADNAWPVHVITKSSLIERDIDVISDISRIYAAVSFTITTANDSLGRKTEPQASLSSERFRAMRKLADKGVYTGITYMPVLPFINDTLEELEVIMQQAADVGASYVLPMFGLTLRKGSREYYYKALDRLFPGVRKQYETCFGNQYICNSPSYPQLFDRFLELKEKYHMEMHMKFYDPASPTQLSLF